MNDNKKNKMATTFAEIVSGLNIYNKSFSCLQYDPQQPRSAVAIIVKKKTYNNINIDNECTFRHDQILFLERKLSVNDKYSGEICFPGGKQEHNQTLLKTAIRQTFQQTNIYLKQQHLIGCIDRKVNLILSAKKTNNHSTTAVKHMVVYAFIFVVPQQQITSQIIKLNSDEMSSYRWVNTSELMDARNICWFDYSERLKGVLRFLNYQFKEENDSYMLSKDNEESPLNCVSRALSPALEVGMNKKLFGVTLYITLIVLRGVLERLQSIQQQMNFINKKVPSIKSMISSLKQIRQRCQTHIVFQINQPIDDNFIIFEKKIRQNIQKLRPKL